MMEISEHTTTEIGEPGTTARLNNNVGDVIRAELAELKTLVLDLSTKQWKKFENLEVSVEGICSNMEHFSHNLKKTLELVDNMDIRLKTFESVLVKLDNLEEVVTTLGSQAVGKVGVSRGRSTATTSQSRGRGRSRLPRIPNPIFRDHSTVIMVPTNDDIESESIGSERTSVDKQPASQQVQHPTGSGNMRKVTAGSSSAHSSHGLVKRFTLKPSPMKQRLKFQRTDVGKMESSRLRPNTFDTTQTNSVVQIRSPEAETTTMHGLTMPAYIKCKFRPTVDMDLGPEQVQLCAYVWCVSNDDSDDEILVKTEDHVASRKSFQCFCLPQKITPEILKWMAIKATWMQQHAADQTIWSLPPSFAEDVANSKTIEQMVDKYVKKWMWPYPSLSHIYVPIEEKSGHCYLMVVCTEDKFIYHFDSNLDVEFMESRSDTMQKLCEVISEMLTTPEFPENYLDGVFLQDNWELSEARGIANRGHSNDSAACVMDWVNMEHMFKPNISGRPQERVLRMRVAIELLTGSHNELWPSIKKKVAAYWLTVR